MRHFFKVNDLLYRGGSPTPDDVVQLKKMGVKNIVSLDEKTGEKISKICKQLHMNQYKYYINIHDKKTLKTLLQKIDFILNLKEPTFVHCVRGKDRTGLFVALYRCLKENWGCKKSLEEAKKLGFATGLDFDMEKFYTKLICNYAKSNNKNDVNEARDIVSNMNEIKNYHESSYDNLSWSPFEDYRIKKYPDVYVNRYYEEQYPSRESYGLDGISVGNEPQSVPTVGIYDQNTQGLNGAGPSLTGGGFIY